MKLRKAVFVLVACVFFTASASFAQQVKTDYDRNTNFAQYKTYSWEKVQTPNPLLVDRIKGAVRWVRGRLAVAGVWGLWRINHYGRYLQSGHARC